MIDAVFLDDVQGDGAPDLAVMGWDATWMFPGPFTGPYDCDNAVSRLNYIADTTVGGDFNGDGLGDILTVGVPDALDAIYIHLEPTLKPRTAFEAEIQISIPQNTTMTFTTGSDIDGDGSPDLIALMQEPGGFGTLVAWSGYFEPGIYGVSDAVVMLEGSSDRPLHRVAEIGDIDGNGADDLVVSSPEGSAAYVLFGPLPATGLVEEVAGGFISSPFPGIGRAMLGSDVDNDGVAELLMATDLDGPTGEYYLYVVELVDL